jgi:hypothetical protein
VLLGFPRPRQWPGRLKDSRGYAKRPTAYAGASLNEHLDEAKDTPAGTAARIKSKVSGYCAKAWAVLGTLAGPLQVQELKWEAGARFAECRRWCRSAEGETCDPRYYCCYGLQSSLALFIFFHNTPVKNKTRLAQTRGLHDVRHTTFALKCGENGFLAPF